MTHRPDPFEQALESLRPAEVSPELFDCIGQTLADQAKRRRARRGLIGAMTTAAAACLIVSAGVLMSRNAALPGPRLPNEVTATFPSPLPVEDDDDGRPVLASYQRALSRSPESFDALLDRHAAQGRGRSSSPTTFTLASNVELIR